MGCRSFLTPDRSGNGFDNVARARNYEPGKPKYYGRFNQGVVTINLVDVACSSAAATRRGSGSIFDERLELCHQGAALPSRRASRARSPTPRRSFGSTVRSRASSKGETIDKLLYGGYSTISLGYAGLYECVKYMKGVSHTDAAGKDFAISCHAADER